MKNSSRTLQIGLALSLVAAPFGVCPTTMGQAVGTGGMERISKLVLSDVRYRGLYAAVIDTVNGYGYFATANRVDPGWVIKVDLKGPVPVEVGAVAMGPGESNLVAGVIDVAAGHAYFGTTATPGKVIKIALGKGNDPPAYVGSLTFNAGENSAWGAVLDASDANPANHYAYFATATSPGRIVKVALGPFQEIGSLTLWPGEDRPRRGVIDSARGYAYFATTATTPRVIKVALGAATAEPTRVGTVTLDPVVAYNIGSAVIDSTNGYAYFGTYDTDPARLPARIYKVALGPADAPPTLIGTLTLGPGARELCSAVVDEAGGYAYFGTDHTYPGRIYQVRLGVGDALPKLTGVLRLQGGTEPAPLDGRNVFNNPASRYGEVFLQSAVFDPACGHAYFGTDSVPGQVVKVSPGATRPRFRTDSDNTPKHYW